VKSGKGFDLDDFRNQMQQMKKMGGLSALIDKLPSQLAQAAQGGAVDDRVVGRTVGSSTR
jgi:signal recognition particle subunit SRP54